MSNLESAFQTGEALSIVVEPRTGFVRQEAQLEIMCDEHEIFGTDWPHGNATFPSRLKALATALRNCGFYGRFQSSHHGGRIELRKLG